MLWLIFVLTAFSCIGSGRAAVAADLITNLPGINFVINFKQYSGYLNPDSTSFLHYWLVESQGNPSTDPLLLWLNGGPGCSSMDGLFTENGPFRVTNVNTTISENVYAWNKVANVLYLESPTKVGFSYTTDRRDTKYGDNETALLNYNALKDFFNKFPEYNTRDFFISGESYAGIYLPTLTMYLIQDANIAPRFKGMAIGNGYLAPDVLQNALVPMIYEHVLVGEEIWNKMVSQCCKGNAMACDYNAILSGGSDECYRQVGLILGIPSISGLDPYNLYDECYYDNGIQNRKRTVIYQTFLKRMGLTVEKIKEFAKEFGVKVVDRKVGAAQQYPDCYYDGLTLYLDRQDVRQAIHIPDSVPVWQDCANLLYQQQYTDMAYQLKQTIAAGVRIVIYNGDVDTVCNAMGDKQFIDSLGQKQIDKTLPWEYNLDTIGVAGFETKYEGITFLSVRGSGHFVPADKPREALQMIANFIWNKPFSTATGINTVPQPLLSSK